MAPRSRTTRRVRRGTAVHSPRGDSPTLEFAGFGAASALWSARVIDDLVYDVGMNNGDDTAHYLRRGFRVVGVEANPLLAEMCASRFRDEVSAGRLTIVAGGIAAKAGRSTFWVNDEVSDFSAFDRDAGCRDGMPCHPIEVPCVPFDDVLAEHGMPYYLKVDIEGNDGLCLDALNPGYRPAVISIEAHRLNYLVRLQELGYARFRCVDQSMHNAPRFAHVPNSSPPHVLARWASTHWMWIRHRLPGISSVPEFPGGSSGPIPDPDAGDWRSFDEVAFDWLAMTVGRHRASTLSRRHWFDFHAC